MPVLSWIKRHLPQSLLALILFFLCLRNFTPGTYLTGWDNLMPELNIWLNLKRSLFAVWQQYQGLGLVGGMAHATDLIRQLILLPFTLILPNNLIRYLWHFSMLFLGTLGVYFGLRRMEGSHLKKSCTERSRPFPPIISFAAALFYLLNFGSIQYFWVPLESFSTFWGFFPWLIFYLWNYLKNSSSKNLKKLIILNILAIPSFYVQTIFIVYLICLFLIFLAHFISVRTSRDLSLPKTYFSIYLIIFLINSFWLLPQLYFLKTNLQNPAFGIGNFMSNEETFARNQMRGNFSDFLLLRGYYFDFSNNGSALMAPWVSYLSNQYILICAYFISFIVLIGLIFLLSRPKKLNLISISILLFFTLSTFALLTNLSPFKELNFLLRSLPLINQIFRSPWTKFLVPTVFTFTFLFAYGLKFLQDFLQKIKYSKTISNLPIFLVLISLIIISYPAFNGNYVSPKVRQKIPVEYFEIFDFFKTQNPSGRIANLPQGSFWGWTNYKWGISGSGFLWYGIEQPILDRAFDAWNLKNEQYYWELSHALQNKNPILLENIFSKYSIEYIIFDNNIYFPDDKIYAKLSRPTKDLLDSIPSLKLIKNTQNIFIYQTSYPTKIYQTSFLPSASSFNFAYTDQNYQKYGDYITSSSLEDTSTNLFTNRLQSELSFNPESLISNPDPIANQGSTHSDTSQNIFAYNFPKASLAQNYLVKIVSQHKAGLPLKISAVSDNSQFKYFETLLPASFDQTSSWFYLPARQSDNFDNGLTFIFNNTSFVTKNQNSIYQILLYSIPVYQNLSSPSLSRTYLNSKSSIFYYKIKINTSSSTLVLPQSYSPAWLAFYFDDYQRIKLLDHSLINNWANGWEIPYYITSTEREQSTLLGTEREQSTLLGTERSRPFPTIYIFFWPQLLEFFGIGLLIGTIIWILKNSSDSQ